MLLKLAGPGPAPPTFLVCFALLAAAPVVSAAGSGEAVYNAHCASCHDRETFKKMPSTRILQTLESGVMSAVAPLAKEEREAVAAYLGSSATANLRPEAFCRDRKVAISSAKLAWNGWSPSPGNTRYQPAETAGLTIEQIRNLKLKWAFGFDGDLTSFSQPAVLDGQVFAGSSAGIVYALRADTGCIQWTFQGSGPVRTAIVLAPLGASDSKAGHAILFGDQAASFYAVEAETGKLLWKKKVDEHPAARVTGSPAIYEGVIYVPVSSWEENFATQADYHCCTFRGSVVALRIRDGSQIWKTYTVSEVPAQHGKGWGPSGVSVWSAPTVDAKRGVLYVTTGNNYSEPSTNLSDSVLAMELATGRVVWSRQVTPRDIFSGCTACMAALGDAKGSDFDFGSSAMLVSVGSGRDVLVAGQKSGVVWALDPDRQGEVVWQTRVAKGSSHGGVQWGMASDGQNVYAPIADGELRRIPNADGVAQRVMDPNDGGGLAALRLTDGSVAWKAAPARVCAGVPGCSPSQLAAATAIPGVIFSGALDGHIRAYAAEDGKVIWDFNTLREFPTVNGVKANGGALNGSGPVVVNGMVLVNSGYDHFGSITGNVLLAFGP
jgi:polyvinyl alcohol dehydrogenase (cytochrome)